MSHMSLMGVAGRSAVIINLQKTPKDSQAALVIHAKCDAVMGRLCGQLGQSIPGYLRKDRCAWSGSGFSQLPACCISAQLAEGEAGCIGVAALSCSIRHQPTSPPIASHVEQEAGPRC